jgi:ATP-binding cassette subfamily B protein
MDKQKSVPVFKRLSRVFSFVWKLSPAYVLVYVLLFLLNSLFPYVVIYCSALIIDGILAKETTAQIMVIVYWMIGVDLGVGILIKCLQELLAAWTSKLLLKIQQMLANKTHSLAYEQIEDLDVKRLLEMAEEGCNGSGGIDSFMQNLGSVIEGTSDLVYSCVLLSTLFKVGTPTINDSLTPFLNNPWSALIIFAAAILSVALFLPLLSSVQKASYKAMLENMDNNRQYGYFYNTSLDYSFGKDIRLFRLDRIILGMQSGEKFSVNATWKKYAKLETLVEIVNALFSTILAFLSFAFFGLKAMYGLVSVGQAVSYAGSVTLLSTGLGKIVTGFIEQALTSAYLQNYFIYMSLPSEVHYGTEKLDETKPLEIVFDHITFTYPRQKDKALDDVSLTIKAGEKLAIVGANGAGKTTLMKLICRFYEPDSGRILVNGKPLESYDEASAHRLFSIVFQDFSLFSFPIKENVAASNIVDESKAIDCLKRGGIYEKVSSWKDGINTILYNKNDENGVEISGGEAQKIAIARALYKDSPLVILDEPTSALDPKSEADIYENFSDLVKGKTSVFISHRMSSTMFCDDIIVIDKGKIAEEGNHKALMKADGLYKKMWDAQAQYYR